MMKQIFLIGLLGSIGATLRFLIHTFFKTVVFSGIPLGTLVSNLLGCTLAGFLWGISSKVSSEHKELIILSSIGFLGSLTTFSTLVSESYQFLEKKEYSLFYGNILLNFFLCFFLFWLSEKSSKFLIH
jgi:CrcB protein